MYLTVYPLRATTPPPGSIPDDGEIFQEIFSLADYTLPTCPGAAENGSVSPQWLHPNCGQ